VVDIEGRLKTAQASADRLRALLGSAGTAADIVAVEGELAKRESEIESLQGRSRVLSSQVDFATVNVRLTEDADLEVNREVPGFFKALAAGWVVLVSALLAAVALAGFLLPFVPFALALWWVLRRHRRRRPPSSRPPPVSPPSWPVPGGGPNEAAPPGSADPGGIAPGGA